MTFVLPSFPSFDRLRRCWKLCLIVVIGSACNLAPEIPSSLSTPQAANDRSINPSYPPSVEASHPALQGDKPLLLATTTSTQDTGLLDLLVPLFESQTGITVKTIAVGTGQAIQLGMKGNADVLLVHDPSSEKQFMTAGFGKDRVLVMHNEFILVGPAHDPAAVKGKTTHQALQAIAEGNAPFISRGDDSGTHKMEISLWRKTGQSPQGKTWYIETGQGMGPSLIIASEKGAYILTDRATFLVYRDKVNLQVMVEGDPALLNVYHVITVNPEMYPQVNYEGALAFLRFLVSPEAQKMIGMYGIQEFGQPLFVPDAGKSESDLGLE